MVISTQGLGCRIRLHKNIIFSFYLLFESHVDSSRGFLSRNTEKGRIYGKMEPNTQVLGSKVKRKGRVFTRVWMVPSTLVGGLTIRLPSSRTITSCKHSLFRFLPL